MRGRERQREQSVVAREREWEGERKREHESRRTHKQRSTHTHMAKRETRKQLIEKSEQKFAQARIHNLQVQL